MKIFERIIIAVFLIILIAFLSISIYRAVINSQWYEDLKFERWLNETLDGLLVKSSIDYIYINEEQLINAEELPENLFNDINRLKIDKITDPAEQHRIFREDSISVFYKDSSYTVLFIDENDNVYLGTGVRIECPSLVNWFKKIHLD